MSTLREAGRDVFDMLDVLAIRHGAHVTRNGWATITDDDATAAHHDLITRLSTAPPTSLGGMAIIRSDRPAPDVFRFWTEDDTRVALRPSGTEPKVKYYCEAIVAVTPPDPAATTTTTSDTATTAAVESAKAVAERRLDAVSSDVTTLIAH